MSLASWFCRHQMVEQLPSCPTCRVFLCTRCGTLRKVDVPCNHNWVELERLLTKPVASVGGTKGGEYTEAMWFAEHTGRMELLQGKTTIVYRCSNCQIFHTVSTAGVSVVAK